MAGKIRKAEASDISQLTLLEKSIFSFPHTYEQIAYELNNPNCLWLVYDDNSVAGYVSVQYVLDEGYIGNVAVKEEYRRQGIADALIDEAVSFSKNLKLSFLSLEVRASNSAAINLYEKHGFKSVAIQKDYYTSPKEDAIIMTLNF